MELQILYQTPELVVCGKPAGVLSQGGGETSMVTLLQRQLGGEIFPVHRLDREVGGVMVYARTREAAADLSRQIQQGTMYKEYLAVLQGVPEAPSGCLTDLLYHDQRRNKTYVVSRKRRGVKEASLLYRTLQTNGDYTLVQIRLLTGRTHQIRVQFSSRQLPLMGDGRYGGGRGQIQLWSFALTLDLPEGRRRFSLLPDHLGTFDELKSVPEPLIGI